MKLIKILLLTFLLSTTSYAQTAARITKGESAPFDGVLITDEKAIDLFKKEQENIVLKDLRIADKELTAHYQGVANDYRKQVEREQFKSFWGGIALFIGGILVTSVAVRAAGSR